MSDHFTVILVAIGNDKEIQRWECLTKAQIDELFSIETPGRLQINCCGEYYFQPMTPDGTAYYEINDHYAPVCCPTK